MGEVQTVLVVEDNPADVERIRLVLSGEAEPTFRVLTEQTCAAALGVLGAQPVDAVLLDLGLPDARGLAALEAVRAVAGATPVVVLTGMADATLASRCLDEGADDYLCKDDIDARTLRRAIGYAIYRKRGEVQRGLTSALTNYQALSSRARTTVVTSTIAGMGPLADRDPGAFSAIVNGYTDILDGYVDAVREGGPRPRTRMEQLATLIGDRSGGPQDMVDVHVAALERSALAGTRARSRALTLDGRLMALEMMGILVDYYRSGYRRGRDGARP